MYMLCKNNNFPINPVYMDTSEIRLPDGTLIKQVLGRLIDSVVRTYKSCM
jgi:hypothetical protein